MNLIKYMDGVWDDAVESTVVADVQPYHHHIICPK